VDNCRPSVCSTSPPPSIRSIMSCCYCDLSDSSACVALFWIGFDPICLLIIIITITISSMPLLLLERSCLYDRSPVRTMLCTMTSRVQTRNSWTCIHKSHSITRVQVKRGRPFGLLQDAGGLWIAAHRARWWSNQCRNWSTAERVVGDMISEADAENTSLAPHIKGVNHPFQILDHRPRFRAI